MRKLAIVLALLAAVFLVEAQDNDAYAVGPFNVPCPDGWKIFTFQAPITVFGIGTSQLDLQFSFDPNNIRLADFNFNGGYLYNNLALLGSESGVEGDTATLRATTDSSSVTYVTQTLNRDITIQVAGTFSTPPITTEGLALTPTTLVGVIFIDGTGTGTNGNFAGIPTVIKFEKCPLPVTSTDVETSTGLATDTSSTGESSSDTGTGTDGGSCTGCGCDCVANGICTGFDFSLFIEEFCPSIRFIPSFCFCGTPIPEPDDSSSSSSDSDPNPPSDGSNTNSTSDGATTDGATDGATVVDGHDPGSSEDCDDDDNDNHGGHHKRHYGWGTKVKCRHRPSWWDWFAWWNKYGPNKHHRSVAPRTYGYNPIFNPIYSHHGNGDNIDCPWFKLGFRGIKQCKPGYPCLRISKSFSGPRWATLETDPSDPNTLIGRFTGTVKFSFFDPNKIDLQITAKYKNGDGANSKDELELSWELGGNGGDVWPIKDDQLYFSLRISTNGQFSYDLPADKQSSAFKTFSLTSRKGTSKTGLELGFKMSTENNAPLEGIKYYPYAHGLDLSLVFDKDNFGPDGVLVYDPTTKMVYSDPGSASSLASWLSVFAAWF